MPSDADEVGSGCLLLSHLRCSDDSAQLMLDYSTMATPTADVDAVAASNASTAVNVQLLQGCSFTPFLNYFVASFLPCIKRRFCRHCISD